jgi:hypothetical protein
MVLRKERCLRSLCLASILGVALITFASRIWSDPVSSRPPALATSARSQPSHETARVGSSNLKPVKSRSELVEAYGKLPLSFEINQGQSDSRVKFLSRGSGYSLFLTSSEAVLALRKGGPLSRTRINIGTVPAKPYPWLDKAPPVADSVVRMKLIGATPNAKVSGLDELPGKSNYFIGNDPKKWCTDVPNFAKVKYANVYPGVDLVYYGNQHQLEYDFVVQPGADPRQIQLSFHGANRLGIDADGNLIVSIAGGEVVEHKPIIYQDIGGIRRQIGGTFELRKRNRVGFKLARFDRHRRVTIDPGLVYSTYLGGNSVDQAFGITLDSLGNAYVTGYTYSSNFPVTEGTFQDDFGGVFVTKLNNSGSALIYSTYFGPNATAYGIAVDTSGNAYITGYTVPILFPTTPGAFQTQAVSTSAFVTKLNSSGSTLIYSTFLSGGTYDEGKGIAVDVSGNAYVTGFTESVNFPTTAGALQTTFGGSSDAFVTKLNSSGSALIYSTFVGGSDDDQGNGIALDSSGNAYITGSTNSVDFPITAGAFQTTSGGTNAFVSKLNSNGTALIYSTFLGGSNLTIGDGIALDSSGNAYITGYTVGNDFPTTAGAVQTTWGGFPFGDAFVTKLNSSGSNLIYSTYLGGSGYDWSSQIAVDSSGNAYVTGYTSSRNFPITAEALQATFAGDSSGCCWDVFVTKLNSSGSALLYSSYLAGSGFDLGYGIALDSSGNAYITGSTLSSNFPVTEGAFQTTWGGSFDAFVTKLNLVTFAGQPGAPNCHGQSVSALAQQYGGLNAAASALGFPSVQALQSAIRAFCGG